FGSSLTSVDVPVPRPFRVRPALLDSAWRNRCTALGRGGTTCAARWRVRRFCTTRRGLPFPWLSREARFGPPARAFRPRGTGPHRLGAPAPCVSPIRRLLPLVVMPNWISLGRNAVPKAIPGSVPGELFGADVVVIDTGVVQYGTHCSDHARWA